MNANLSIETVNTIVAALRRGIAFLNQDEQIYQHTGSSFVATERQDWNEVVNYMAEAIDKLEAWQEIMAQKRSLHLLERSALKAVEAVLPEAKAALPSYLR